MWFWVNVLINLSVAALATWDWYGDRLPLLWFVFVLLTLGAQLYGDVWLRIEFNMGREG